MHPVQVRCKRLKRERLLLRLHPLYFLDSSLYPILRDIDVGDRILDVLEREVLVRHLRPAGARDRILQVNVVNGTLAESGS